jgi:DNA-binding LacI/PurR family transcriptional regulator
MASRVKKAPSISDVARRAGVSISTISRAMSDRERLNPQTYERVQRAIRELNYRKTRRGPAPAQPRTVALVVPSILDPFFSVILHGIDVVSKAFSFNVLFFDSCNSIELEEKNVARIVESGADGVVMVPVRDSSVAYGMLRDAGVPVVLLDRTLPVDASSYVVSDDEEGAFLAVKYLVDLGHRDILYFGGDRATSTEAARLEGYRRAMRTEQIGLHGGSVTECSFDSDSGYDVMNTVLRAGRRPSAVFAASDLIAFGAMKALRESGLRVPQDVSVVGYGDLPFAAMIALTTVSCPVLEMAKSAMTLLVHVADDRFIGSHHVVLRPALVLRSSCARVSDAAEQAGADLPSAVSATPRT